MKKTVASALVIVLLIAVLPMSAFARGHCRNTTVSNSALCSVEDCATVGYHWHDGVCYAGHSEGDGHDYHQICDVQNCTEIGSHVHNGVGCVNRSARIGGGCHR